MSGDKFTFNHLHKLARERVNRRGVVILEWSTGFRLTYTNGAQLEVRESSSGPKAMNRNEDQNWAKVYPDEVPLYLATGFKE